MKYNRRTEAERNEILKLKEDVLERIEAFNITSYELQDNTTKTSQGIEKIIKRITKYPALETLQEIDAYIKVKYENFEDFEGIAEENEKYNLDSKDSKLLQMILNKLQKIEDKIETSALKQDIIFEIIKNAPAEVLKYTDKIIKEKFSS